MLFWALPGPVDWLRYCVVAFCGDIFTNARLSQKNALFLCRDKIFFTKMFIFIVLCFYVVYIIFVPKLLNHISKVDISDKYVFMNIALIYV